MLPNEIQCPDGTWKYIVYRNQHGYMKKLGDTAQLFMCPRITNGHCYRIDFDLMLGYHAKIVERYAYDSKSHNGGTNTTDVLINAAKWGLDQSIAYFTSNINMLQKALNIASASAAKYEGNEASEP